MRRPSINVIMPVGGSVLCSNYRGVKCDEFHGELKDLLRVHRPLVIILLEPRISREVTDGVCKKLGRSEWVRSEADGFRSRIWLFWNQLEIKIKIILSKK